MLIQVSPDHSSQEYGMSLFGGVSWNDGDLNRKYRALFGWSGDFTSYTGLLLKEEKVEGKVTSSQNIDVSTLRNSFLFSLQSAFL